MRVNPLLFDTILILNSAAPSIYAKQFQSYLAAHRQAMVSARVPHANLPFVFSVTSEADVATKIAHPIANSLCFLVPSLRREYPGSDFILEERGDFASVRIPQYYYYQRTPGHNPLLVNRFIERLATATDGLEQKAGKEARWTRVRSNLAAKRPNPTAFDTTLPDGTVAGWQIAFPPHAGSKDDRFSWYERRRPVVWTRTPPESGRYRYKDTAYWVVRCPTEISSGHNDIWSQAAMDMYAALHRISLGASPGASPA
jgi:hypothetical protein